MVVSKIRLILVFSVNTNGMNVIMTVEQTEIKEDCLDFRVKESENLCVVAVMLSPQPSRSARINALKRIKNEFEDKYGKQTLVTADLDIYCRIDTSEMCDILPILYKRGSYV